LTFVKLSSFFRVAWAVDEVEPLLLVLITLLAVELASILVKILADWICVDKNPKEMSKKAAPNLTIKR